jgi:hypothetical protein
VENFRVKQTERGNEALHMFADYLESVFGNLNISVHEHGYSTGEYGSPDIVFREYGIEVKRIEFLAKKQYGKMEDYHAFQNALKMNGFEWKEQKTFCRKNKKKHVLVVVFTWGRDSLFVGFTEKQIDTIREKCKTRPSYQNEESSTDYHKAFWFGTNSFTLLKTGTVLNNEIALCQFFDAIPENSAEIRV